MIEQEQWVYDFIKKNPNGITVKIGRENQNTPPGELQFDYGYLFGEGPINWYN